MEDHWDFLVLLLGISLILGIAGAVGDAPWRGTRSFRRKHALRRLAATRGMRYRARDRGTLPIRMAHLLGAPLPLFNVVEHALEGSANGRKLIVCDLGDLYSGPDDPLRELNQSTYILLEHGLDIGTVDVRRGATIPNELERVELESAAFNRGWTMRTSDRELAYGLMSPRALELFIASGTMQMIWRRRWTIFFRGDGIVPPAGIEAMIGWVLRFQETVEPWIEKAHAAERIPLEDDARDAALPSPPSWPAALLRTGAAVAIWASLALALRDLELLQRPLLALLLVAAAAAVGWFIGSALPGKHRAGAAGGLALAAVVAGTLLGIARAHHELEKGDPTWVESNHPIAAQTEFSRLQAEARQIMGERKYFEYSTQGPFPFARVRYPRPDDKRRYPYDDESYKHWAAELLGDELDGHRIRTRGLTFTQALGERLRYFDLLFVILAGFTAAARSASREPRSGRG